MKVWRVILAALVIFSAGVVTGGLAMRLKMSRTAAVRPLIPIWPQQGGEFLNRMQRRLDLSAEQHERIEKILKESQERMKILWEPVAPQAKEESRQARERILAELNPAQRKKFEEIFKPRGPRKAGEGQEKWRKENNSKRSNPTNSPEAEGLSAATNSGAK